MDIFSIDNKGMAGSGGNSKNYDELKISMTNFSNCLYYTQDFSTNTCVVKI